MKSKSRGLRQAIRTAILLGAVSVATLANEGSALRVDPPAPLCYCHCSYENGSRHCTKMCELPQFQNRWWAVSCRKKNPTESKSSSPSPTPGSRKTNRTEQALRLIHRVF